MRLELEVSTVRRRLFMKKALEVVGWLSAVLIFALASHSVLAAQTERHDRARKTQEVEAEKADVSPVSILRGARTVHVRPNRHVDSKYLEYKLQKYAEFRDWRLVVVEEERAADLVIKIDKSALNYIFSVVDPETSVVAVSGKIIAVNKQLAAEYLGTEIIKKMKNVRASSEATTAPRRKSKNADDEDDGWSES